MQWQIVHSLKAVAVSKHFYCNYNNACTITVPDKSFIGIFYIFTISFIYNKHRSLVLIVENILFPKEFTVYYFHDFYCREAYPMTGTALSAMGKNKFEYVIYYKSAPKEPL